MNIEKYELTKKNKYNVHHKRQTLENFLKDIHEFHFEYNGDRIVSCVSATTVIFDDEDIPDEVKSEIQNIIYEMMDKYEDKWALPKGAKEIIDAYMEENYY